MSILGSIKLVAEITNHIKDCDSCKDAIKHLQDILKLDKPFKPIDINEPKQDSQE